MSVTVEDLKPKPFKIIVKGVELTCQPLKLSHALSLAKIGNTFQNPQDTSKDDIKNAEKDMNEIISELIPEITFELDMSSMMQVLNQLMDQIEPDDNKELKANNVKFNTDPKA